MKSETAATREEAENRTAPLIPLSELEGYSLSTGKDALGKISDFLIDESAWAIRIIVVDIGNWLTGRRVALDTSALRIPDPARREIRVDLTRKQIESGPTLNENETVSGRHRKELSQHYGWPMAWPAGSTGLGPSPTPLAVPVHPGIQRADGKSGSDSSTDGKSTENLLRSFHEIGDYSIEATDGSIGQIEDFIADPADWSIRHVVVDTRKWLPGKKVLIPVDWLRGLNYSRKSAQIDLRRDQIRKAPAYEPGSTLDRDDEDRLRNHHQLSPSPESSDSKTGS